MAFLKRLLASAGIGGASVMTNIHSPQVTPGGVLQGETLIVGGEVSQKVEDLYLDVIVSFLAGENEFRSSYSLIHYRLAEQFTLQPGDRKTIPFEIALPWQTPLSTMGFPVNIRTGLDIRGAADPKDLDPIQVVPVPAQSEILAGAERLGLEIFKVDCEQSRRFGNGVPFVQEFEFKAWKGPFRGHLSELEIMFNVGPETTRVIINADRKPRGLSGLLDEAFDMDERILTFDVPTNAAGIDGATLLQGAIERGLSRAF